MVQVLLADVTALLRQLFVARMEVSNEQWPGEDERLRHPREEVVVDQVTESRQSALVIPVDGAFLLSTVLVVVIV